MTQFVIGIGSQRAGSTLLHRILEECTTIYMNPVKELHYFDTLYKVRSEQTLRTFSLRQLEREISNISAATDFSFIDKRYKNFLRTNMLLAVKKVNTIDYIDLFRPCVIDHNILGEITPEYMVLPEKGINKMRETVGKDTKIILLARNPVKRFISAFKLMMINLPGADMSQFESNLLSILKDENEWLDIQDLFNDYELSLSKFQKHFSNVLFLSYDDLFGNVEKTADSLSDFLGISVSLPQYYKLINTKVNALDETKDLSRETVALLENRYSKQQAYLDKVFGDGGCSK
ncbi:hypothetical protein JCM14076_11420 [Methylosoma difficile]